MNLKNVVFQEIGFLREIRFLYPNLDKPEPKRRDTEDTEKAQSFKKLKFRARGESQRELHWQIL